MDAGIIISPLLSILGFTPLLLLASLGVLVSAKSGVLNIGAEGIMALGAAMGIAGAYHFGSIWAGLAVSLLAGVISAVVLAILVVHYNFEQNVTGLGLWFLAEGLGIFLYFVILPPYASITDELPKLFSLDVMFYVSVGLFLTYYFIIRKTRFGLAILATGENPAAADAAGIDVYKVRWISAIVGGALMGLAGGWFSVAVLKSFFWAMVLGQGWLAIMVVLFARFKARNTIIGVIFFSLLVGLQTRLQVLNFVAIPREIILVTPHIAASIILIVAAIRGAKTGVPSGLAKHYDRE